MNQKSFFFSLMITEVKEAVNQSFFLMWDCTLWSVWHYSCIVTDDAACSCVQSHVKKKYGICMIIHDTGIFSNCAVEADSVIIEWLSECCFMSFLFFVRCA
jgi:hypothetical protein